MISAIRVSLKVSLACYLLIILGNAETANAIERSGSAPKRVTVEEPNSTLIPAMGPERGVTVGRPQPIPPYSGFLGSETGNISVDWVVHQSLVVGHEADFDLVLRNHGPVSVQQIEVAPSIPPGFEFVRSNPKADMVGKQPHFRVAKLLPHKEARIQIRLKPTQVGVSQSNARVTFTTSASTEFRVVQPMLKIAAEGPPTAVVGGQAVFNVTVSNPGTSQAENVVLDGRLPAGLVHAAKNAK